LALEVLAATAAERRRCAGTSENGEGRNRTGDTTIFRHTILVSETPAKRLNRETEEARHRLRQTLGWASEHGIEATGEVDDPIDPLAGIEDELRRYDIDEVIVTTHTPERANWLETGILEQARAGLGIPVRHFVIDGERVAEETSTRNA
jgi:hypothetical protein